MSVFKTKDKTKDGKQWRFKVSRNNKVYFSKQYSTMREAKEAESLYLLKKENKNNKMFNLVATDYFNGLEKIRKKSTLYSYRKDYNNHIKPFFCSMNIYAIDVNNIREWAEYLEKKNISIAYMNKIHNILKNIFDFAIKNHNLKNNPATMYGRFQSPSNKRKDKKIRYITKEHFDIFISVIDNILWKTFFIFLFYTGCRKGETLALKWKHINFDKREILIEDNLSFDNKGEVVITTTKNNKERIIRMSNFLYETLLRYKEDMQKYSDFSEEWFVFGNTIHLGKTNVDRYKKKYFELSGIEEITTHEFRHSHVSLLINEYIKRSIERAEKPDMAKFFLMMSDRLGHTIEVMQNTYMHLFPTVQDEIVDLLDNL